MKYLLLLKEEGCLHRGSKLVPRQQLFKTTQTHYFFTLTPAFLHRHSDGLLEQSQPSGHHEFSQFA